MRVLCGECDCDIVLVMILVNPVQLRVMKDSVNCIKQGFLNNEENRELPNDGLEIWYALYVHFNGEVQL